MNWKDKPVEVLSVQQRISKAIVPSQAHQILEVHRVIEQPGVGKGIEVPRWKRKAIAKVFDTQSLSATSRGSEKPGSEFIESVKQVHRVVEVRKQRFLKVHQVSVQT